MCFFAFSEQKQQLAFTVYMHYKDVEKIVEEGFEPEIWFASAHLHH